MGLFRSETMSRGTLVLPSEGAREFLDAIGSRVQVQFVDMNAQSLQRRYKRYVQRLEEMERILRFLYSEIEKHTSSSDDHRRLRLIDSLSTLADDTDEEDDEFDSYSSASASSPFYSGGEEEQQGRGGGSLPPNSSSDPGDAELGGIVHSHHAGRERGGVGRSDQRSHSNSSTAARGEGGRNSAYQRTRRGERGRTGGGGGAEGTTSSYNGLATHRGGGGGAVFQLDKVEEALNKLYTQFVRFSQNNDDLLRQRNAAIEECSILLLAVQQLELPGGGSGGGGSSRHSSPGNSSSALVPDSYTPTSSSSSARRRIRAPSMGRMNTSSASSSSDSPFESSASLSLLASPSAHGGVSAAAAGGLGYSPSHGTGSGGVGTLGGGGGGSRFTRRGQGRGVSPGGGREAFGEEVASDLRSMAFSTVAGVISTSDQEKFARALFRSMRGNAYTYFQPADVRNFPPEYASTLESKSLFVTYYQGGRSPSSAAYEKVMRLCAAFNARCYVWPTSYEEARRRLSEVDTLLVDKAKALKAYENYFLSEIAVLLEPVDLDGTRDLEEEEDRDDMMVNERRMLGGRGGIGGTPRARRRKRRSLIEEWRRFCVKEKAIYTTLNYFEASDVTIRADCWFLTYEEAKLRLVIAEQSNRSHASAFLLLHESPPRASSSPPTYFRLPPFLLPFQQLVDTYGVPRYKEANPAIFACVFFPFLFGIMYGDVGHGVVLLLIAAALFYIKAHNGRYFHMKGETIDMLLGGRHMILLLGVFATYAGFIYNDVLSLGVDLFGTRWSVASTVRETNEGEGGALRPSSYYSLFSSSPHTPNSSQGGAAPSLPEDFSSSSSPGGAGGGAATYHELEGESLVPSKEKDFPYPFGFDPAWKGAVNELLLFNSFKMKFSIIVGFFQMLLGILLKAMNALYFRQMVDFFFEALPQLFLFISLIGYMTFLVLYKWVTPVDNDHPKPSLINVLIDMNMKTGGGGGGDSSLIMFDGQEEVQQTLRVIMFLCIPIMLLGKPLWLWWRMRKKRERRDLLFVQLQTAGGGGASYSSYPPSHRRGLATTAGESTALSSLRASSSSSRFMNDPSEGISSRRPNPYYSYSPQGQRSFSFSSSAASTASPNKGGAGGVTLGNEDESMMVTIPGRGGGGGGQGGGGGGRISRDRSSDDDDGYGVGHHLQNSDDFSSSHGEGGEESLSEVFIHQMIETIEFVLGTISNTASYLRLWALSLAHQQLALVFFEKTIGIALHPSLSAFEMIVKFVFLFPLFAIITFFVMICMDSLECFLHALRLQWVEFQSKFYKADGHAFTPLNFSRILRESKLSS